ncbi:MAG TPA: GntG family PLP-dependent aldolase [Candidatus Krumholzibacteria bacterium]|nr:GntG family PLP-dependent aldolase [Candidatus Krumholzibacteria bacterium]HPD72127.1 GntG family PLP-dependent aldolase [Candidatus Krumholzibacteria bacterium]HRY40941.1 GntG family PLP-dependent aldolase [Candidatus Krumholzibacteria bacterium]
MVLIDLRSDTVTKPTRGMYEAMVAAPVGDDVLGDDPTVLRLQDHVAGLLGKDDALFVPSGTMANQIAVGAQTRPGDQVILEADAHIYHYECAACGALWGVQTALVPGRGGALAWDQVAAALPPDDVHFPAPALVCLENTHNRAGGRILPQDLVAEIGREAHARGLRVHLDGARLWNAHVATGRPLRELCAPADTVSVCFSKGLGAPVGSCLAGDRATLALARRLRKRLGGGMRQSGLLAAACLYALEHHLDRLAEDHAHARRIAAELVNPRLEVGHAVETNIVVIEVAPPATAAGLIAWLAAAGVLALSVGPQRVRLIPNLGVAARDLDTVLAALNGFAGDGA